MGLQSEALMVSNNHTTAGTIPTWVTIPPTKSQAVMSPNLLLRAMFGFLVQLQAGSVLVSMASITSGGLRNDAILNQNAIPSLCHHSLPWESWPCLLLSL